MLVLVERVIILANGGQPRRENLERRRERERERERENSVPGPDSERFSSCQLCEPRAEQEFRAAGTHRNPGLRIPKFTWSQSTP